MSRKILNLYKANRETTYPYNLISQILGARINNEDICLIPLGAVKAALETLSEKEQFVLEATFGEGRTMRETGEMLGLSSQRISQIQQKALRKLHHPTRMKMLVDHSGYMQDSSQRIRDLSKQVSYLKETCKMLKKELISVRKEKKDTEIELRKARNQLAVVISDSTILTDFSSDSPIEILKLPGVTRNCLKRAGIFRISDLESMSAECLSRVPRLGKNSVADIQSRLALFGIILKESSEKEKNK